MTLLGKRCPWSPKTVGSSTCFSVSLSTFGSSFYPRVSISSLPEKHILLSSYWPLRGFCCTTCKIGVFRVSPQPVTYWFSLLCHSDVWEQRTGKSGKYFFTSKSSPDLWKLGDFWLGIQSTSGFFNIQLKWMFHWSALYISEQCGQSKMYVVTNTLTFRLIGSGYCSWKSDCSCNHGNC